MLAEVMRRAPACGPRGEDGRGDSTGLEGESCRGGPKPPGEASRGDARGDVERGPGVVARCGAGIREGGGWNAAMGVTALAHTGAAAVTVALVPKQLPPTAVLRATAGPLLPPGVRYA
mmetsp:Transcript_47790/g.152468  ORF Transcript_47790/g.152468 Transcript_47790/m.152468 type:complete len:118 (-) Transcript_47790:733-1086(-)